MSRIARNLAALLVIAVAAPAVAQVTDEDSVRAVVERALAMTGALQGCVANAGGGGMLVVECPIVRDTVTKPWQKITMYVTDNSPQRSFRCSAYNRGSFGDNGGWYRTATPVKPHSYKGKYVLTFSAANGDIDRTAFYITCEIPDSGSKIHSYRVVES